MVKAPLGSLSRSRRDWNVEGLKYSHAENTGANNQFTVIYSLNNNSNDGSALAVYGMLGFHGSGRGMMYAWPASGLSGANNGVDTMLNPTAPTIPGFVNVTLATSNGQPLQGLTFKADGATWLTNFDAPLFILPVNWRLAVVEWSPIGFFDGASLSAMTFLYGQYPKVKNPKSSS